MRERGTSDRMIKTHKYLLPHPKEPLMSKYNPNTPRPRRRTIEMPELRSELVSTAAHHLGMTGEDFIQLAITKELKAVYADMLGSG